MKRLVVLAFLVVTPVQAQQQPQPFTPLVLDEKKWNELSAAIDEISMPAKSYRQLVQVLVGMQQQAQRDAAAKLLQPPEQK